VVTVATVGEDPTLVGAPWPGRRRLADRYRLEDVIASGGVAIVWRAFDEHLARPVAVKLLHPHHAGDPTVVERFQREARAAAGLSHPNVVRIYDVGREDGLVWLVMELVEGPSLRDVLATREPLDPAVVTAVGEQVARALAAAHERGLVHRDIKPANILVASDGTVKVTDFGIAKALGTDETLTSTGTVMGTAAYVAPEQLETSDVDARADVYALGVVLYEALLGRPAFSGDTPAATAAMRLTYELVPPRRVRSDVPEELDAIVTRATRRGRGARFADGAEFAEALTPLLSRRPSLLTARLLPGYAAQAEDLDGSDATTGALARPGDLRRLVGATLTGAALTAAVGLLVLALRPPTEAVGEVTRVTWPVEAVRVVDPTRPTLDADGALATVAVDGDPQTVWLGGAFPAADLGDDLPGIGLLLDLGAARDVRGLVVTAPRGGADLAVHAWAGETPPPAGLAPRGSGADADADAGDAGDPADADDAGGDAGGGAGTVAPATGAATAVAAGWGPPRAAVVGARAVQELAFGPGEARWWLVWITRVPPDPAGTFALEISDVTVLGPG
jgi:hypothetical protein